MSTYLPAVFSTVRTDGFDRKIDRMFDEALRGLARPKEPGSQPVMPGKTQTDSTFRWPFPAGNLKTSPWK